MRRIKILLYWLFRQKNNVSLLELIHFLLKPRVDAIAKKFFLSLEKEPEFTRVNFKGISLPFYWPQSMDDAALMQVAVETFDRSDWHYYQKNGTKVTEGEILLDIGAAEGLFSFVVARSCQQILLIEPNPLFYPALQMTFAPFSEKTTIFQTAVGNSSGFVNFESDNLAGHISNDGEKKIPISRIDDLIPTSQPITYLKADIEGFEYPMLQGAKNTIIRNKPKIAITTYHLENDADAIIDLVLSYVPTYKYKKQGIFEQGGKPVMVHFWH